MKIKKEDFDKLKQLDRIEFILRLNKLEEKNEGSNFFYFISRMIILAILIFISDILFIIRFGIFLSLNIYKLFFILVYLGIVVCIFADLIKFYFNSKNKKELEEKYFKVEVKK